MFRVVACLATLALGLSACGDDGEPKGESKPESTKEAICSVLSSQERAELVGTAVDEPAGAASDYPDFSCRWRSAASEKTIVQVASAPVSQWVDTLPAVLDQVQNLPSLSKKDKRELAKAEKLLDSGKVDDAEGCGIFSLLAEIGGFPKGSKTSVSYLDSGPSPLVAAQHCDDGWFSSVAFTYKGNRQRAGTAAAAAVLKIAQRLNR